MATLRQVDKWQWPLAKGFNTGQVQQPFERYPWKTQKGSCDNLHHDAFVLQSDMCWEYEIFLTASDQEAIEANPADCVSLIATAAKRQRAEVRMTELTPEHKAEFQAAKDKEISQWLDTETVRKILKIQDPHWKYPSHTVGPHLESLRSQWYQTRSPPSQS